MAANLGATVISTVATISKNVNYIPGIIEVLPPAVLLITLQVHYYRMYYRNFATCIAKPAASEYKYI